MWYLMILLIEIFYIRIFLQLTFSKKLEKIWLLSFQVQTKICYWSFFFWCLLVLYLIIFHQDSRKKTEININNSEHNLLILFNFKVLKLKKKIQQFVNFPKMSEVRPNGHPQQRHCWQCSYWCNIECHDHVPYRKNKMEGSSGALCLTMDLMRPTFYPMCPLNSLTRTPYVIDYCE